MQSVEAMCWVENEDVVGAAPTGDAPTTSEWSTILLPTMVRLRSEVWGYIFLDLLVHWKGWLQPLQLISPGVTVLLCVINMNWHKVSKEETLRLWYDISGMYDKSQ